MQRISSSVLLCESRTNLFPFSITPAETENSEMVVLLSVHYRSSIKVSVGFHCSPTSERRSRQPRAIGLHMIQCDTHKIKSRRWSSYFLLLGLEKTIKFRIGRWFVERCLPSTSHHRPIFVLEVSRVLRRKCSNIISLFFDRWTTGHETGSRHKSLPQVFDECHGLFAKR